MKQEEKIKEAKRLYESANADQRYVLESLFPELKESDGKDEKIRKALIRAFKSLNTIKVWNGIERTDIIDWLEKQGEHANFRNKIQIGDKVTRNEDGVLVNLSQLAMVDKPAAKFHKGDWIIHQGTENVYQVVAIIDNQYQLKYGDNYTIQYCADVDRCTRLWDIAKDAKTGDVLCDGTTFFIFKDLLSDGSVMSYCDYDTNSGESDAFCPLSVNLMCSKITPATKEQYDTLMKAMADAGYEWDAVHKQLKKIEQKHTPKHKVGETIYYNSFGEVKSMIVANVVTDSSDNPMYEDENGNAVFEKDLVKQKPAWSEEDEKAINDIMWIIKAYRENGFNETHIQMADSSERFLKSLKDRYAWKPSNEQVKAIKWVMDGDSPENWTVALANLYNDLKKLREE